MEGGGKRGKKRGPFFSIFYPSYCLRFKIITLEICDLKNRSSLNIGGGGGALLKAQTSQESLKSSPSSLVFLRLFKRNFLIILVHWYFYDFLNGISLILVHWYFYDFLNGVSFKSFLLWVELSQFIGSFTTF